MSKRWYFAGGGLLLVLILIGFGLGSQQSETAELLVRPETGPFQVTVTATGELRAKNSVKIYGPGNARRARLFEMKLLRLVPEGTEVQKGDFVAELDRSELTSRVQDAEIEWQRQQSLFEQTQLDTSLTLRQARDEHVNLQYAMEEARLRMEQAAYEAPSVKRQAEIDFEKAERAYEQALTSYVTQVAQARAKMREVGAGLSKAQNDLDDLQSIAAGFTILAPENGMVVYRREWNGQKLTTGGTVRAWDPVVAELPDLSVMESITYINEVDIQKLKSGQSVRIGLDADPDKKLSGTVTSVANIGEQRPNSDAKVFEVAIVISEADTTLRPAMTTSNTIVVAEIPDALHVPLETIHAREDETFAYVRRGGRTVRQEVQLGLQNENEAIVEQGLTTDDRLYLSLPTDTTGLPFVRLDGTDALAAQ